MADLIFAQEEQAVYRIPGRYKLDEVTGEPMPWSIEDEAPRMYSDGCGRGHELALDLFDWLPQFNDVLGRQGVTDSFDTKEYAAVHVRSLIEQATQILAQPKGSFDAPSHRGIAVGFLDAVAHVVVSALTQSSDARRDLEKLCTEYDKDRPRATVLSIADHQK